MPKGARADRKSTRLNSSHANISYAVFCLKNSQTIAALAGSTLLVVNPSDVTGAAARRAGVGGEAPPPAQAGAVADTARVLIVFFLIDTAATELSPLSRRDALPI